MHEALVVLVLGCVVRGRGCEGPVVVTKFFEMGVWLRKKNKRIGVKLWSSM